MPRIMITPVFYPIHLTCDYCETADVGLKAVNASKRECQIASARGTERTCRAAVLTAGVNTAEVSELQFCAAGDLRDVPAARTVDYVTSADDSPRTQTEVADLRKTAPSPQVHGLPYAA